MSKYTQSLYIIHQKKTLSPQNFTALTKVLNESTQRGYQVYSNYKTMFQLPC